MLNDLNYLRLNFEITKLGAKIPLNLSLSLEKLKAQIKQNKKKYYACLFMRFRFIFNCIRCSN